MTPSRRGPRKPGHSAVVTAVAGTGAGGGGVVRAAAGGGPAAGGGEGQFGRCHSDRSPGDQLLLGRLCPSPRELRLALAGDAIDSQQRERAAREQDGRSHRRAPRSVSEAAGGHRRCDEGEADDRDCVQAEHQPHHPRRNRLVENTGRRGDRGYRQDDGPDALGPGRAAEEHPPHNDGQRAEKLAAERHVSRHVIGRDGRHAKPDQPHQHDGDDAGPQAERLARSWFTGH